MRNGAALRVAALSFANCLRENRKQIADEDQHEERSLRFFSIFPMLSYSLL
jgi:hypothetical protein